MSSDNINVQDAETRGMKRGASLVFDAQEAASNVSSKVANTAEGVYNTVAEAVEFAQTHTVAESVKTGAAVAMGTVQEVVAAAVETVKEKTASTIAAVKENYEESAEIVKKNANIALDTAKEYSQAAKDKTGQVAEGAACAVLKAVDNVKETSAYISAEAQKHSAEAAEIVQKNIGVAKETAKTTASTAILKGQESVAYAKGVKEGVVGAAKGSAVREETDLHTISRPTPIEAPHVSDSTSATQLQEAGINMEKAKELSELIPDKSMASEAKM